MDRVLVGIDVRAELHMMAVMFLESFRVITSQLLLPLSSNEGDLAAFCLHGALQSLERGRG